MEYSSKQSQEKRRGFIDPRTKLALVLILALFVMGGLGGEQMQPLKMILSALPFALLLAEKQWTRFFRGVCILVCGYALLWVMPYLPAVLSYFAQRADYGQAYIDAVQKLMPLWMAPVLLIACFVCGMIGGLLGRALLKKHFEKAGLV